MADRAKDKAPPSLSAYEQYLLGISQILWNKADYAKALEHFAEAASIDPAYGRAWLMIGVVKNWIGEVTRGEARALLQQESREAIRLAHLYEPHDPMIQFSMSIVHLGEGRVEAAQRAVFKAVELTDRGTLLPCAAPS